MPSPHLQKEGDKIFEIFKTSDCVYISEEKKNYSALKVSDLGGFLEERKKILFLYCPLALLHAVLIRHRKLGKKFS